ncbi:hypothetical protein SEA_BRAXOADDIE_22 [Rhodococcus phage Braxoaddie]|nr:hypothetical protein SEA_BRAXOADDIE_22 [Rhodococcus phage Braxoaddie]
MSDTSDDGSFQAAAAGMEAWKTGYAGKPKMAGVEVPAADALYDDVTTGSEFVVKFGWCDADELDGTSLGRMADEMWDTAKAHGKAEGLADALPQYQAVVGERDRYGSDNTVLSNRANGAVVENAQLRVELGEAARLLRIVSEERDVYQAAIERTIGYRLRLWLLTRLAAKVHTTEQAQ